ncbi:Rdx family-domain-containing protein [Dipodascopsis uninucleata]
MDNPVRYPRISIEFCTACKWNLRAAWYAQELLSTFSNDLGEVSMVPSGGGTFKVKLVQSHGSKENLIWDRKLNGSFPDSKDLKKLIRDQLFPERNLGHLDRKHSKSGYPVSNSTDSNAIDSSSDPSTDNSAATETAVSNDTAGCIECEKA